MSCVSSMDVASSVVYFYPKLLAIHSLNPEETGVPEQIRCTLEKLKDDGVYLLDNGMHMLLFVGITANPAFIQVRTTSHHIVVTNVLSLSQDVFGVSTAAQIDIDKTKLVERDNPMSRYKTHYFVIDHISHFNLLPGESMSW